ncbi:MAG TPA: YetF domain-containing protein [Tepidisphaeraceae bacterium]|jgi:uncharacterized membrane protein YcaP (DUF421 family)|nr:YetF domain-containing protein [Tepidisphaeraceae bacterium]
MMLFSNEMWVPTVHIGEFIFRGIIVYIFLLILLRLTGRRQIGQLAPFDMILLLVLSNAVQNAMNGGDNSLTGGIVSACTLVAMNSLVGELTYRFKFLESLIEGRPMSLIHDGHVNHRNLRKLKMTIHELNASLRMAGVGCQEHVLHAVLETTGQLTVIRKAEHPAA